MANLFYELHNYSEPSFPFFCHCDTLKKDQSFIPHWHENPELLCFLEGEALVSAGGTQTVVRAGDTAVVNANELHFIRAETEICRYYCIIVSKKICEENGIYPAGLRFAPVLRDPTVCREVKAVFAALAQKGPYSNPAAKFRILLLVTYLAEHYAQPAGERGDSGENSREQLARRVIDYVNVHYSSPVTVRSVCDAMGFSESYICHTFRESTDRTLTEFINSKRCVQARQLLKSGVCNVSEAALQCGFTNFSYFSKVYRLVFGHSPREDAESAAALEPKE